MKIGIRLNSLMTVKLPFQSKSLFHLYQRERESKKSTILNSSKLLNENIAPHCGPLAGAFYRRLPSVNKDSPVVLHRVVG